MPPFGGLRGRGTGCFQYLLASIEADVVVINGTQSLTFHPDSWVARLEAQVRACMSVHVRERAFSVRESSWRALPQAHAPTYPPLAHKSPGPLMDHSLSSLFSRRGVQTILDKSNAWSWSFFGAWMQMLALGNGIQEPRRQIELWGYLVSILAGSVIYAVFLASLTYACMHELQHTREAVAEGPELPPGRTPGLSTSTREGLWRIPPVLPTLLALTRPAARPRPRCVWTVAPSPSQIRAVSSIARSSTWSMST